MDRRVPIVRVLASLRMSVGHYENFPVASILLPARLRAPVRTIYRFARTGDDLADEGDLAPDVRLGQLAALGVQLDTIERGQSSDWPDLARAIREHRLPIQPFRDLLSAFSQDVTIHRYASFEPLLDYCRRSANPIGRLLLALYRCADERALAQSDAVCTALQLVNFWQDIAIDAARGRVYVPQSELARHGLREADIGADIAAAHLDPRWRTLMGALTEHARALMLSGVDLPQTLGGRVGVELRLVIQGGLRILRRIDAVQGDVFRHRPVLRSADWLVMGLRALRM